MAVGAVSGASFQGGQVRFQRRAGGAAAAGRGTVGRKENGQQGVRGLMPGGKGATGGVGGWGWPLQRQVQGGKGRVSWVRVMGGGPTPLCNKHAASTPEPLTIAPLTWRCALMPTH